MSTVPHSKIPEHRVRPSSLSLVPNTAKSNQWSGGVVRAAALSAIALGFAAMMGLWLDIPRLRGVLPGFKRRRAETRERNRSLTLEALAGGAPLRVILEMICRSVEEEDPGALCSIQLLDDEGTHLLFGAGPSLPNSYNQAINGARIGATAGSCGTAAYPGGW